MKSISIISRQLALAAACFLISFSILVIPINAESSGNCGENVSWTLSNGILTISGTGTMYDYSDSQLTPWHDTKDSIIRVVILDGVTSIGKASFFDCTNLKSVVIADSVSYIGSYAFLRCENLETVKMSTSIANIGSASFKQCESLQSIVLPDGLQSIGYEAFFMCESLVSVKVPASVYYMEDCIFSYCSSLLQASIEASIGKLPEWTFYGCDSLNKVSLSSSITDLGDNSFYDCSNLSVVNSGANEVVCESLTNQIKETVSGFDVVNQSDSTNLVISWKPESDTIIQKDGIENDNVSIGGIIEKEEKTENVNSELNVYIKTDDGLDEALNKINEYIDKTNGLGSTDSVSVNITIEGNVKFDKSLLNDLAGKHVVVNVNANGNLSKISFAEMSEKQRLNSVGLEYSLEKIEEKTKEMTNSIGHSDAFFLKFSDNCEFNITVKIYVGNEYARNYASIYQRNGKTWEMIHSVQVDSKGYASFFLAGYDRWTDYMIAMNVEGVNITNAYIPSELSGDYGGLLDSEGNYYQITGIESKWGITLSQFSLIVFGVLGGVIVLVGLVMFIIFKMQQNKERVRREVMSEKKVKKTK